MTALWILYKKLVEAGFEEPLDTKENFKQRFLKGVADDQLHVKTRALQTIASACSDTPQGFVLFEFLVESLTEEITQQLLTHLQGVE